MRALGALGAQGGRLNRPSSGETFRVVSEETPINVAYSTVGLALHQDLVYYESPPGLQVGTIARACRPTSLIIAAPQFLHAVRFDGDVKGGESTLLDGAALLERFRRDEPEVRPLSAGDPCVSSHAVAGVCNTMQGAPLRPRTPAPATRAHR